MNDQDDRVRAALAVITRVRARAIADALAPDVLDQIERALGAPPSAPACPDCGRPLRCPSCLGRAGLKKRGPVSAAARKRIARMAAAARWGRKRPAS